jgi:hypothetical protein
LLAVDPKTTFKKLKGEAGAKLADLAAVVPIMWLKRTDDPSIAASDASQTDTPTQAQPPPPPSSTARH